jgi:hypothetical protein
MSFASQWTAIAGELPPDWSDARLLVALEQDGEVDRAAALLGPLSPGRSGSQIRLFCARRGPGVTPEALARALERLDRERLLGQLELAGSDRAEAAPTPEVARTLAADWDATLATLPPDWSDIYAELVLTSSDHIDRVALLTSPMNPRRFDERTPGFRFRIARSSGYGVSPAMARRSLERVDEEKLPGRLRILRVLSDTDNVKTQGPVWRVDGAAV